MDVVQDDDRAKALERRARALQLPFFKVSAVTGAGIQELLERSWAGLVEAREPSAAKR
jgi:GTPase